MISIKSKYQLTRSRSTFLQLFVVLAYIFPAETQSDPLARPTVVIHPSVVVDGPMITLGDIAKISGDESLYRDLLSELKGIALTESPPANAAITLVGETILATIRDAGIDNESFGYSIPKTVVVKRKGRVVERTEVIQELRELLKTHNAFDLQVREVDWEATHVVPVGPSVTRVDLLGEPRAGKLPIRVEVLVHDRPEARFVANATVDDWREVPVLRTNVERGMLIRPEDLQVVRLNLNRQPADVVDDLKQLIGKRAKSRLTAGETIRKSVVDIPPLIPRGKSVSMIYELRGFRATAAGIALEDGQKGDSIRLENSVSKRIIRGIIMSSDEVQVEQR